MSGKPRGELGGDRNVVLLQNYINLLRSEGRGLPARAGKPNFSAIAKACGFDRGVFYQNNAVMKLLEEAVLELGFETSPRESEDAYQAARLKDETKASDNRRLRTLENDNLYLRAENCQLKIENARYRALHQLMASTGRMP